MTSNHLILCAPFSSCRQSFLGSGSFPVSQFFTSGGQSIELQLQHQSFQWILRLISFRIDWFDLLVVCRTLKESSPAPKFECITSSLSFLHGTTLTSSQDYGKAIAFTIWTFVGKVMSLFFNMLSRFVRAFLPRSKSLLIWFYGCSHHLQWFWSSRR